MAAKCIVVVFFFISLIGCVFTASKSTAPLLEETVQSLQQTVQSLQQTVQLLQHNVSDIMNNMATADVLRLYLTQEVKFRDELELKMKELENNYTVLQDLYVQSRIEHEKQAQEMQKLYIQSNTSKQQQDKEMKQLKNSLTSIKELFNHCTAAQKHMNLTIQGLQANQFEFRKNLIVMDAIKQNQSLLKREINHLSVSLIDVESKHKDVNDSTENNKQNITSIQRELASVAAKQQDDNVVLRNSTNHITRTIASLSRDLWFNISSLKTMLSRLTTDGKLYI